MEPKKKKNALKCSKSLICQVYHELLNTALGLQMMLLSFLVPVI